MKTNSQHEARRIEIMEKCFDCYCKNGLGTTGIKALADACSMTSANLYVYFKNIDELIIDSTAHCMAQVESEFLALAPNNQEEAKSFINVIPYWTAKNHGEKYRLMYQIYTHPKYLESGKKFFSGVEKRYSEYAEMLEPRLGISRKLIKPMIFTFIRACVHFSLFNDEAYLKPQLELLWQTYSLAKDKYTLNETTVE